MRRRLGVRYESTHNYPGLGSNCVGAGRSHGKRGGRGRVADRQGEAPGQRTETGAPGEPRAARTDRLPSVRVAPASPPASGARAVRDRAGRDTQDWAVRMRLLARLRPGVQLPDVQPLETP